MTDALAASEFSLSTTYLNTAYFGPLPLLGAKYVEEALQRERDPSAYPFSSWRDKPEELRTLFARCFGGDADMVALRSSVSDIVSEVAFGLDLGPGDTAVVMDGDYPSDVLPWMESASRHGFELVMLSADIMQDPSKLEEALPRSTKAITFSHTRFDTGYTIDLEATLALIKARGIFVTVDATQSLGGIGLPPSAFTDIDVLAVAGYKWLLGPYGVALAHYSPRAVARLRRSHVGWLMSPNSQKAESLLDYSLDTLPGARRFDRGQAPNFLAHAAMKGALETILSVGIDVIEAHNRALVEEFLATCPASFNPVVPGSALGSVLCLKTSVPVERVQRALSENQIDASVREGNLRLSFHLFNSSNDVEVLVRALRGIV